MSEADQTLPPYDVQTMLDQPFPERIRMICLTWLFGINATPVVVYLGYVFKILFFFRFGLFNLYNRFLFFNALKLREVVV